MILSTIREHWLYNLRKDILAGMVVALALIPESIAFSAIAGVDPKVGLYASFCIAVTSAIFGGRPGMISAATGAMALLMITLVKSHGLEYLLAASILTGVLQILVAIFRLGELIRFVSRSVMIGFMNSIAVLIFLAQIPELSNGSAQLYILVAAGLAIIYLFPLINKTIPSPLVCIIALTAISVLLQLDIRSVGDLGQIPDTFPLFLLPSVPFNLETLSIILPYSLTLAVVGLLESLLTASIVDEMTDSVSSKNKECVGQGLANIVSGLFGGMAGCGMIGQSVINIRSGGRSRLSCLLAGIFLLILFVFLGDFVKQIPMAALVAIMIMVSIGTFNWHSLKEVITHPISSTLVMLTTMLVVITTHDLAQGVLAGIILNALFFAREVATSVQIDTHNDDSDKNLTTYKISGHIFFVATEKFLRGFNVKEMADNIIIDISEAHFWDCSAATALKKVTYKFEGQGKCVQIVGLDTRGAKLIHRLTDKINLNMH